MLAKLLTIGIAGALGTLSRYGLSALVKSGVERWLPGTATGFPWPTLVVNLIGCFAFGLLFAASEGGGRISEDVRPWALIGFMGAFTTFSTFQFETVQLLRSGGGSATLAAAGYVALSFLVGFGAVIAGLRLGQPV